MQGTISVTPMNIEFKHLGKRSQQIASMCMIPSSETICYFALFGAGCDGEVVGVVTFYLVQPSKTKRVFIVPADYFE